MPRSDYEKLLKIAPDELKYPYFFQIPETDPGYYYTFAKIRNSNTSAFLDLFKNQRFNMGLLIDIFPVDVCDLNDAADNFKKIQELTRENTTYMRMSHHNLSDADKCRIKELRGVPIDIYYEIQKIAMQHEKESRLLNKRIVAVFTGYSYEKMIFNAKDLSETVLHDFEGFRFPIPIGYDEVLRITYGNYMQFPPVLERGRSHDYLIDPDRSYQNYTKLPI